MNQSPIALGLVRLMMQLDWISSGTEILVWAPSFIWLAQLNGSSIAIVSSRFHIQTKLSVFLLAKLQSWFESSTSHVLIRLYNYMKTSEWRNHCILYYILISVSSCVVYQELLRLGLVFSIIFLVLLDFHKLESHNTAGNAKNGLYIIVIRNLFQIYEEKSTETSLFHVH